MKAGWTFRIGAARSGLDEGRNRWVVLSDPDRFPSEIVAVLMTRLPGPTDRRGDERGEPTMAGVWTRGLFEHAIEEGDVSLRDPIDDSLVETIRLMTLDSPKIDPAYLRIAGGQGWLRGPADAPEG